MGDFYVETKIDKAEDYLSGTDSIRKNRLLCLLQGCSMGAIPNIFAKAALCVLILI